MRLIAGLLAGLALLAGFLVWRLSSGPISLDDLAPYVAHVLADRANGLEARVDHTLIALGDGGSLLVVARGVHLRRGDGDAELTLPELAMGFSLRAALRGLAAPTRIVLRRPDLRLQRAEDGTLRLGLGGTASDAGDWADRVLHELAAPPNEQDALGYLRSVAIRDAVLTIDDRALDATWRAKRLDVTLSRDVTGIAGDMSFVLEEPSGSEAALSGDLRYVAAIDDLVTQLNFTDLSPAAFATAAPQMAPLAALPLPLSGRVRLELNTAALRVDAAWCDLTIGAGRIEHPVLVGGGVAVASGVLSAAYDPAGGRVIVDRLRVDLGGPQLSLSGTVDGLGGGVLLASRPQAIDVAAELHVDAVPADRLAQLWPEQLAPNPRAWVTDHVHDGTASAAAHVGAHVDFTPDTDTPLRLDRFDGTLEYRGLTVDYFRPLPPLRGVDGSATFDRTRLDLTPATGSVEKVQLTDGTAKLSKLDTHDEEIAIDFGLSGPLRDVLDVLDSKPLGYARELKIDPAHVAGRVEGRVSFHFPLKRDLALREVDFSAKGALSDVAVDHILAGQDLSDGQLQLQLDRSAVTIDGTAHFADVPAKLSWRQSLVASASPRARYTLKASLDDAARRRLGYDWVPGMIKGPVGVDVTYAVAPSKKATASLALDFATAALNVPELDWQKPAGDAASAQLELDLADDEILDIRQAVLKSAGLDARAGATFGDIGGGNRGLLHAEIPKLVAGETDAAGVVTRRQEGGWRIELHGLSYDAAGLLNDLGHSSSGATAPLVIDAALDRVLLGPKREARDVKGQLFSDGVHWQAASLDATMFGGGKAQLRFGEAAGDRSFRLSSNDFGGLLRLFDISDNVAGGQILVTGQTEDSGAQRRFRGKVDGADYRIVGAPLFAKLLSVASFSGIGGLLSGEGVPFSRLKADFTLADGRLDVQELRAYGGAIGINVSGQFDVGAETLDIAGTLVPANAINSLFSNIPVIKNLVPDGLFAANFRVSGPVANATITVNPLSALAPGVLRKLFLFDAPEPSPATPQAGGGSPG
jgi:hypothetical protein